MASNQANVPIEMIEADYPIRIERYGFVADSGGPGEFRGGLSLVREYRVLTDDVYFGVRSDKCIHPPHGLFGGLSGAPSENLLNPGPDARRLPPMPTDPVTLYTGDVYRHVMAGGGGYGDPHARSPASVREDLLDGRVTRNHARDAYGVVLGVDDAIDWPATQELRAARAAAQQAGS